MLKWVHRSKSALTFLYTKFEISKFSFFNKFTLITTHSNRLLIF